MLLSALIPFFTALVLSALSIPIIIRVAAAKHLMDEPDSDRKVHSTKTPTLGGVAIFTGTIFAYSAVSDYTSVDTIEFMISSLLLLFFAGIFDDIMQLSAIKKLGVQVLCALLITTLGGLRITSLWGMLGVTEINEIAGVAITLIFIVSLVNAFNLIDGVNGLAGGLGLIASLFFGKWFLSTNAVALSILAFSLSGAILGFLWFNFRNAKIFMGDTGSMMIGFVISILAIRFVENNRLPGVELSPLYIKAAPSVALSTILIPLLDMTRVFFQRIYERKSPFAADRKHIHHILIDLNLSHTKVCISLYAASIGLISLALLLKGLRSLEAIIILSTITFLGQAIALHLRKNRKI